MAGIDSFAKLVLHCDGADATTTFTDSSSSPHTVTTNNQAQIDTAQSEFGGGSGLFDGSSDNLTLDGSADFAFGTGDWTIDFWVRFNSVASTPILYDSRPNAGTGAYPTIFLSGAVLIYHQSSANRITGGTSIGTGAWHHVAVARAGTSTKMFLDGAQEGSTYSDSTTYLNGTSRPMIGANGNDNGSTFGLNGWLDEIRVSKGIARWTTTFTPPTAAYSLDTTFADGELFSLASRPTWRPAVRTIAY